jgi:secreted trypsin-like serine protease
VQWDGCGASLIHNDIILTAAHCNEVTDNGVIVGATRAGSTFGQAEARHIVARRPHPSYDDFTIANDFMVMKLNQPVSELCSSVDVFVL